MRIAHTSDFHFRHHLPGNSLIGKRRGGLVPGLLADAIDQINGLAPDLLAVTGDLVGYPLYGLVDPDLLSRGVEVDGLISRFDRKTVSEEDDAAILTEAYDSMLVSQKHAHTFTLIEVDASASRDAGIMNVYKLDSKRSVEAFCDRARAILEIAT